MLHGFIIIMYRVMPGEACQCSLMCKFPFKLTKLSSVCLQNLWFEILAVPVPPLISINSCDLLVYWDHPDSEHRSSAPYKEHSPRLPDQFSSKLTKKCKYQNKFTILTVKIALIRKATYKIVCLNPEWNKFKKLSESIFCNSSWTCKFGLNQIYNCNFFYLFFVWYFYLINW